MRLAVLGAAVVAALAGSLGAAAAPPQYQPVDSDVTWAKSLILTADDVGADFTQGLVGSSSAGNWDFGCSAGDGDFSDLVLTGDGGTASYVAGKTGTTVSSFGGVFATPAEAQAAYDRLTQPGFARCLGHDLSSVSTKTVKIAFAGVDPFVLGAIAPRAAAFRIRLKITVSLPAKKAKGKSRKKPAPRKVTTFGEADILVLGDGRATALVVFASFDAFALPDAYVQQFGETVASRLAADPAATG